MPGQTISLPVEEDVKAEDPTLPTDLEKDAVPKRPALTDLEKDCGKARNAAISTRPLRHI